MNSARLATLAVVAAVVAVPQTAHAAPSPDAKANAIAVAKRHAAALESSPADDFAVRRIVDDADGASHVRLDRTHEGLPVLGGDAVLHLDANGDFDAVSLTLEAPIVAATDPQVSAAEAKAKVYADRREKPKLVIDAIDGPGRLAWQVTTAGRHDDGTPSRVEHYIDALSGEKLRSEETIQTVEGQGLGLYVGTVRLDLTQAGSAYELKSGTRGNTYTGDANNSTDGLLCTLLGLSCPRTALFASADTSFGNGTNSNRESAGVDAQYGTDTTWDYFKNVHGRLGIKGDGSGSFNRVHYGRNYVNAFWDGTKMTYGDGDGTNYGPLTSLDVAGHEMTHGVTQYTANLAYSGESGGLNESTSDIFGSLVEAYAANANDPGDYLIGEEFDLKKQLGFRRMDDPDSDGSSVNCYTSNVGNLDVHYSSGVGNHFFYLLAEGSGPKTINGIAHNSPVCSGGPVAGIGRDKAGAIWYRALDVYMTSNTNYAGARAASLSAASDLFGPGSAEVSAVAAAWSAVNVS